MKKLLLLTLVVFGFMSVASASIGETGKGDQCTIKTDEAYNDLSDTEKPKVFQEKIDETYKKNAAAIEAGAPACACYVIKDVNGAQTYFVPGIGDTPPQKVRYCVALQEPIAGINSVAGQNGISLFSNYIKQIYKYGASIIGIICVLVIVVSGIQISLGGANSEFVNQGKERIMQALLSLILLFGSAVILRTVNPGFFTLNAPQVAIESPQGLFEQHEASRQIVKNSVVPVPVATDPCETEKTALDACTAKLDDPSKVEECPTENQAYKACAEISDFERHVKDNDNYVGSVTYDASSDDPHMLVWKNDFGGNEKFQVNASSKKLGFASDETGLKDFNQKTINGAVALQAEVGKLVITGGTESGHESGSCSHSGGCKIDFRPTPNLNNHLRGWNDCTASYGVVCKQSGGSKCVYEKSPDHWDCSFK